MTVTEPPFQQRFNKGGDVDDIWQDFLVGIYDSLKRGGFLNVGSITVDDITINDLTADRLTATDSDNKIVSVLNLALWILGTSSEIEITNNGDGTITIGLPDDVVITNDLEVGNDLNVVNNADVGGNLDVTDDTATGNNLSVGNNADIGNNATVGGNAYIKSDNKFYFDNV